MQQFDLRESKTKFIWILLMSIAFAWVGTQIGGLIGTLVSIFGVVGVGFSAWKLLQKGKSGLLFSPTALTIELANGKQYTYDYVDVEKIAIQQMQMPQYVHNIAAASAVATMFTAPANIVLMPELYGTDFACLAIKVKPGKEVPQTGKSDTYLYSGDKLNKWKNDHKLDVYLAFFNNVSVDKRKKLLEYLTNVAKQQVEVGPPLEYIG